MDRRKHFIGIFLISLATLLLELSLTRVMSVALWYHFGFLVISTALLGFGTAGVVLASWKGLREKKDLDKSLSVLSLLFGLVTVLSFWVLQQLPFNPFSVATDKSQLYIMPLYYITIAAPFFVSGLIISLLFTRLSKSMSRLYAVDLLGAALGCLLIVLTMPNLGGSGSVVMAGAMGAAAAIVFSAQPGMRIAGGAVAAALVFLSLKATEYLPITVSANKQETKVKREPVYTKWNTFSFIEVFERKQDLAKGITEGGRRFIIDGGTAATGMDDLREGVTNFLQRNPHDSDYQSSIAYLHIPRPSILNIGSGAGRQVLDGLHKGARKITCVEINPIINDVVSNRMKEYWGGLFEQPGVTLITDEARNYINRSKEQYDAIVSSHTISNAAMASGALSLAENYVLTKEAFQEYFDHLTPNGTIYFTRPEMHLARLLATGREVLADNGITDFGKHFYVFRSPIDQGTKRPSFGGAFVMKKSAFTPEEVAAMNQMVGTLYSVVEGVNSPYTVLYTPYQDDSENSIYKTILTTPDLESFYASNETLIRPATDDKPFFNQHMKWSAISWRHFEDVFSQDDPMAARMALENKPVAEITLLLILLQSVVLAGILILIPLFRFSREGLQFSSRWRYLGYFACLGLGFIMIEIAFIQRFTLYLGQPVYTLAVIIAGLLLSTGLGSYLTGRLQVDGENLRKQYIPLLLGVLLLTSLVTPVLFNATIHWALSLRVVLTLLLLAPLGVLLGMPFPTGIKLVSRESDAFVPWAWGVNGFFTVIGSVGAVILGMMLGFKLVIALAGLIYLAALLLLPKVKGGAMAPPVQEPTVRTVTTGSSLFRISFLTS